MPSLGRPRISFSGRRRSKFRHIIKNTIMPFTRSILFLFLLFLSTQCPAQPITTELEQKVDALLADHIDDQSPGSAILVVKDGEVLLNKGYGLANLSHGVPITPTTVFDLASVSKQFAGFAIASLIEEGKIKPEDDVRKYIPELPNFGATITIDHLLHHTSGIRDWTNTLPLAGWSFDDVISFEQILRMTYLQRALNFEPGSEYNYSNTGYNLLAEVVQRVSGQSFRTWTDQHIFQPLGMNDTRFLDDHTEVIARRASGYYRGSGNDFHTSTNQLMALGSSSLFSTTTDLAKWVMQLDQPKPEYQAVVERMQQISPLNDGAENNYAYGLSVDTFNGTYSLSHSGSWASFRTYLMVLPEEHLSIVVLNNDAGNPFRTARTIASWYVPEPEADETAPETASMPEKKLSPELLDTYTGNYRLGPGWYVTLTRRGDQLWTQATNESDFPMTALAEDLFRIDAYGGRTMRFFSSTDGEVSHMIYAGLECPKLEPTTPPSPETLKAYSGRYVSRELLTEYEVVSVGEELKLRHHRLGEMELRHAFGEDFTGSRWFIGSVEFYRNSAGAVQGFRVTSGRARRQEFQRLNQ